MAINRFIAVLDTCVIAPMPVADTLFRLAEEPAFYVPRWSRDIEAELRRTLMGRFGYSKEQADRRITTMDRAFPEALVEGYEDLIEAMRTDPKDRHVLACAVHAGAHAIVTNNKRHFPVSALGPYSIDCLSAGEFLLRQYDLNPDRMISILWSQAHERGRSLAQLLDKLPVELQSVIST
jgi:predicted nucleic acid-binding protein